MKRHFGILAFLVLMAALLVVACTPKPAVQPVPTTPPSTPAADTEGKVLYSQKCAACHGANAEGTAVAPAIAGHSVAAIKEQVRNPMGTMPALDTSQLSDSDLDKIADFIADLAHTKAPVQEWEKSTSETIYYWMALLAIRDGDIAGARQHLQDAVTSVKQPVHQTEVSEALNLMSQGKVHEAEHKIEMMAGAGPPSGVTTQRFYLALAQRGIAAENATEAKRHLEHFMANATDAEKEICRQVMTLIDKGDFHMAEHEIEELMA